MSKIIESIWISANPGFKRFNNRLIQCLSQHKTIACWEYYQNQDEASSLDVALVLLHDYLKSLPQSVNLIGHGTGGLLALLYARKYPHKVKSLTLLGVGFHPAVDWQAHYYAIRKLLPCSQEIVLTQMIQKLFGYQNQYHVRGLIKILKQDLNTSPSPHSLFSQIKLSSGGVSMPLMICGSENDEIIDRYALYGWLTYLKEEDVLWECLQGHHFFHYFFAETVSRQILQFWQNLSSPSESLETEAISLSRSSC